MKRILPLFFLMSIVLFPVACSSEIELPAEEPTAAAHPVPVEMSISLADFDEAPAARGPHKISDRGVWKDGDIIWLKFSTDKGSYSDYVRYTASTKTWTLHDLGSLEAGTTGKVEAYAFGDNANTDRLSNTTPAFVDAQGSYNCYSGKVGLTLQLAPATSRLRLKGAAGTSFTISGLACISSYDRTNGSVMKSTDPISLTIGDDGYSPYVYCNFATPSAPQLQIESGSYVFTRTSFVADALQTGKSGCMTLPTSASHNNWAMEELPYVNLGLTSGTLWATCNVGATKPEDYGEFFAWGETTSKSNYDWNTYFDTDDEGATFKKYNNNGGRTILDVADDVAKQEWGSDWCMPTKEQMTELQRECTWTWTTQNNVNGYVVKSKKNSKSIFLPAAGFNYAGTTYSVDAVGNYWARSLSTGNSNYAERLRFESGGIQVSTYNRCGGFSVRPVRSQSKESKIEFKVGNVAFNMIFVEHGSFEMGQSADGSHVTPVHSVTISKDYWIGETEVTQALWYAVMGQKPTSSGSQWESTIGLGDSYPAYRINWNDCQEFITKLNQLTGQTFRLPTEAEWEYAAKGGNKSQGYTYSGSNTINDVAWYGGNSYDKGESSPDYGTHPVATKKPNELGLYDMSGNVWEWCSDWYSSYSSTAVTDPTGATSGSYRVIRGDSWDSVASSCRTANRSSNSPTYRSYIVGFRLCLSPSK